MIPSALAPLMLLLIHSTQLTFQATSYADYASLSDFRSSDFYDSSASSYSGFFSGILEFDVSGTGNSQLASMRSSSTLASFTFDTTNDDVQVVAPMTISAAPSNNYTSNWSNGGYWIHDP